MTKLLNLIFLLIFSLHGFGQVEIINMAVTNPSVNVFYIGVDNRIKLKLPSNSFGYKVTVTGAASSLTKISDNEYIIRVSGKDTCLVALTRNSKIILTKKYITEFLGSPVATLNGILDTAVSTNRILLNPFLTVIIPNSHFKHGIRVLAFQAVFIIRDDSVVTNSTDHSFSDEQIKLVKQLVTGDKVLFNSIRGSCASSRTQTLQPFWIKVQ